MNKEQTEQFTLFQALKDFLVFYLVYILIGCFILYFVAQEASEALEKAPENKKMEVVATRMSLYSHFM